MENNNRRRNKILLLFTVFLLTLVGGVAAAQQKAVVVGRSVVLTDKAALALFKQCSRSAPTGVEKYWVPTAQDLQNLNAALPGFLKTQNLPASVRGPGINDYYRQCAGFSRKGEKYIYVNAFSPKTKEDVERFSKKGPRPFDWTRNPMTVCDGGSAFFGVEYNLRTKQFSNFYFNGPYEGKP